MCVVSMVSDFYRPKFNEWTWPGQTISVSPTPTIQSEIDALRNLIKDFREAMEAARRVDELTAQPDCVDPKKATLVDRVADLERRLDALGV